MPNLTCHSYHIPLGIDIISQFAGRKVPDIATWENRKGDRVKESTKNIIKMHGRRYDRAAHNFIYFVFYDLYIRILVTAGRLVVKYLQKVPFIGKPWQFVFNRYHGKVITQEDARKILSLKEDVILGPDRTERIVPFKYANSIILKEPEYIAVMDCACRMNRENPCEPVTTCIAVGRTTAQFWLEHGREVPRPPYHPAGGPGHHGEGPREGHDDHRLVQGGYRRPHRGHLPVLHLLLRGHGGRPPGQAAWTTRVSIIIPSGYVVEVDEDKCVACGTCVKACNIFYALSQVDGEKPVYDVKSCKGCGVCVEKCPQGARTLVMDGSKGLPLDIDMAKERLG